MTSPPGTAEREVEVVVLVLVIPPRLREAPEDDSVGTRPR